MVVGRSGVDALERFTVNFDACLSFDLNSHAQAAANRIEVARLSTDVELQALAGPHVAVFEKYCSDV